MLRVTSVSEFTSAVLRPMNENDLKMVLAWRNHPKVRSYMYKQQEISLEDHTFWFEQMSQDPKRSLLVFESNGIACGFINIHEVAHGGIGDWGFYAAPDAPKGTGRELGVAALRYAFKMVGLHKLCGQVLASNERSIRFHLNLGFLREGVLRQQHYDGRFYHDILCFGLLATDWHQSN